jgi:hypothetical protein
MHKFSLLTAGLFLASCTDSDAVGPSEDGGSGMTVSPDGGGVIAVNPDGSAPMVDGGRVAMPEDSGIRPYGHVKPSDNGVKLGVGVVAAAPTSAYTGPLRITTSGVIENVVIQGCLEIAADNVTLRNVSIRCGAPYPVLVKNVKKFVIEYSKIQGTSGDKDFYILNSTDVVVRRNDILGGEDFFFVSGPVDGLTVSENYMHALLLSAESHADGFQIGESAATTGTISIRGNYISADPPPGLADGITDILFATTNAQNTIVMEDNFFGIFGLKTLRCYGTATCTARRNVYAQGFTVLNQPGAIGKLLFMEVQSPKPAVFECNRLQNGALLSEFEEGVDRVAGTTHIVANCPSF